MAKLLEAASLNENSDNLTCFELHLWDVKERQKMKTFKGHKAQAAPFLCWPDFSPNGRFIATGSEDSTVSLSFSISLCLSLSRSLALSLSLFLSCPNSPDDSIDNKIFLFHRMHDVQRILPGNGVGHSDLVDCASWHPHLVGLIASCSDDGSVVLWGTSEYI